MLQRTRVICRRGSRHLTARAVLFTEHGDPVKVLQVRSYEVPSPSPDQFLVRFLASPINPADLNQIEGVYPAKPHFKKDYGLAEPAAVAGNEGLVEVIGAGSNLSSMKWQLGQWALMKRPGFGTWRTHALASADDLVAVDASGLSPVDVATASINPCTAYRMLRDFASLKPGDWWIQNGANSAVGQSAIQIGKLWGFKSINVIRERAGSDAVRQQLLALGADLVITDKQLANKEFMQTLKTEHYKTQPPTLALNCVGGSATLDLCRQLAADAHIVTYGAMARQPLKIPASMLIFKNFCFHGFWISPWNERHPEERQAMLDELFNWMRTGQFKSPAAQLRWWSASQDAAEAEKTFREALEASQTGGKQILCVSA